MDFTYNVVSDVVKYVVIPLVGVIYYQLKKEDSKIKNDIKETNKAVSELEEKLKSTESNQGLKCQNLHEKDKTMENRLATLEVLSNLNAPKIIDQEKRLALLESSLEIKINYLIETIKEMKEQINKLQDKIENK